MRIDIMTLFPDMCNAVLSESIIGRARQGGKVEINCVDIGTIRLISTGVLTINRMAAEWE